MTTSPTIKEGFVDYEVPSISRVCQTWYKIVGDLKPGARPLVAIHGGPGVNSSFMEVLSEVTIPRSGVFVVYDQIGNGLSTHLPEKMVDSDFWTEQLFLDELENLLKALKIEEYDLIGHSWGGMLGARHAALSPLAAKGLKHLVLVSTPSSMPGWIVEQMGLRAEMPQDIQDVMDKHEKEGTIMSDEYQAATRAYYAKHLCTLDPMPPALLEAFGWIQKDPTVYVSLYGPSEFVLTGSLKNWTVVDDLSKIQVPTLVTNGANDKATDEAIAPFVKNIPQAKWVKFENSSHMAHHEEREEFMRVLAEFLYN